jgi:hypothetical protein
MALLTAAVISIAPPAGAAGGLIAPQTIIAKTDAAKKPADKSSAAAPAAKKAKAPKAPRVKTPPHVHTPEAGPWDQGALWVTMRAGFNRAAYRTAAEGNAGFGFGFTRMYNPAWSLSGVAERQVLGKFADASEIEMPLTLELDRHFNWNPNFRPFVGFGGGTYYHKFAGTTADHSDVRWGALFALGANAVVGPHSMLGLEARAASVNIRGTNTQPVNPVFGTQDRTTGRFGLKLTWSVTY